MKTMTCKQLGGACELEFRAKSFEEMAKLSRSHGQQMFEKGETAHLEAMKVMQRFMTDPSAMQKWMEEKKALFDSLPEQG